jgi:hypothetical protein
MPFTKNIKTDYGAAGNGQVALTNVTTTAGSNALAVSSAIFAAGDVGKAIAITGAGAGGLQPLVTTISGFTDSQHVTLTANAVSTLAAQQMRVYWGTDDSTPFLNWQTDAKAQGTNPCVLTIPSGVYCNFSASGFFTGVFDLTINMGGATLAEVARGGIFFQSAVGTNSARLNQVNQGDTVLSLVTGSQTSIFTVGNWVALTSLEMQGSGGYPPNFINCEYHKIIAIGSGTITIDAPATYTHKTTYPFTGDSGYDTGGPATLFMLKQDWDQSVVINGSTGGTLDAGGQVQLSARSMTINNCTIYGREAYIQGFGLDVSMAVSMVLNNCTIQQDVEVDKDITSMTWNNCTCNILEYQSASIANSYVIGGTYTNITGVGRNMTISGGCTVTGQLQLGCIGFGAPLTFAAFNSSLAAINYTNAVRLDLSPISYANGVFSVPNASATALWSAAIPGTTIFWEGTGGGGPPNWGHQAVITDIWTDGVTTFASSSPVLAAVPQYSAAPGQTPGTLTTTGAFIHPAYSVTFSSCVGCADAVDLSQAPSGAPLYSYTKRTYASGAIGTTSPFVNVWGRITAININVTAAASGAGPLHALGKFGTQIFDANNLWHLSDMDVQIDLSHTGLRTITPAGVTGAVGADVIPALPSGAWMPNGIGPYVGSSITGGAVTIEIITDERIPAIGPFFGVKQVVRV